MQTLVIIALYMTGPAKMVLVGTNVPMYSLNIEYFGFYI